MHRYEPRTLRLLDEACDITGRSTQPNLDFYLAPSALVSSDQRLRNYKISAAQFISLSQQAARILQPAGFRGWVDQHFDRGDISSYSIHSYTQDEDLIVDFSRSVHATITLACQPNDHQNLQFVEKDIYSACALVALVNGSLRDNLYAIPYALNISVLDACRVAQRLITFVLNVRTDLWNGSALHELFALSNIQSLPCWAQGGEIRFVEPEDIRDLLNRSLSTIQSLHRDITACIAAPHENLANAIQESIDDVLNAISLATMTYMLFGTSMEGVYSITPVMESTIPLKPELSTVHNSLVTTADVHRDNQRLNMPEIISEDEYLLTTHKDALFYLNNQYAKLYKNQRTHTWSDPQARAFTQRQRLISVAVRWYAFVLFGFDLSNSMGFFGDPAGLEEAINRSRSTIRASNENLEVLFASGTIDERIVVTKGTNQDGYRMSLGSLINASRCAVYPITSSSTLFRHLADRPHILNAFAETSDTRTSTQVNQILDHSTRIFTIEANVKLNEDQRDRIEEGLFDILPLNGRVFLSIRVAHNTSYPPQYTNVYLIQVIGGACA